MINRAKRHFLNVYDEYKARADHLHRLEIENTETQDLTADEHAIDYLFDHLPQRPAELSNSEVDNWFTQGLLRYRDGDIKGFWSSKGYDFKIIIQMARDHLAVPASSAASERVFSFGGDIITKKRNKLGGKNTRYLLCLRDWGIVADEPEYDDDFDNLETEKAAGDIVVAEQEISS